MLCAIHAYAFRVAVRLAFMGMPRALPRFASRLWVCCSHCRGPLRVRGYAARIAAVRFASVGMLLALSRSASRSWACCSHCRGPLRVCGYAARITDSLRVCGHAACIAGPLRVHEYAACIAGSLRVRRDRGDAVSLTLRLCLPRVLPVSTLRDV